jgi:uncharacterized membrane protein YbjE (DUF340 family)
MKKLVLITAILAFAANTFAAGAGIGFGWYSHSGYYKPFSLW